jgi:hypothetical protein
MEVESGMTVASVRYGGGDGGYGMYGVNDACSRERSRDGCCAGRGREYVELWE